MTRCFIVTGVPGFASCKALCSRGECSPVPCFEGVRVVLMRLFTQKRMANFQYEYTLFCLPAASVSSYWKFAGRCEGMWESYSRNRMISVQYCARFLPSTELTVCCVYVFVFSYATSCRHSFFRALTPEKASPQRRPGVGESWGVVFRTGWGVKRLQIHELSKLVSSRSHPPFIVSFEGLVNSGP